MRKKTGLVFLVLMLVSWAIELGGGWAIMWWYWNTAWYRVVSPSNASFAAALASWSRYTTPSGRVIDLHWTPQGITLVLYSLFVGVHVVVALWHGLLAPFFQRWNQGVRYPIAREREQFEAAFAAIIRAGNAPLSRPRVWLVHDGSGLEMRWHGYTLIIDRELLKHRALTPLLAVQLGHANSEDRLAHRLYAMLPAPAAIIGAFAGWPFALGHVLTYPLWMWYWKARVYAADEFAVEYGQGPALVRTLDQLFLRIDQATRGGRWLKPMPYVAQRIDHIQHVLKQQPSAAPQGQRIL